MAKTTLYASNLLKLVFNATTYTGIAVNDTGTPLTNLYVSLHTADPGVAGTQTSSETTYGLYARQAVARTTGGWTVTNNVCSPVANIVFPASNTTTPTITYFGIGSLVSTAGALFYSGTVTPNIVVSTSVVQTLTTGSTITET